MTQSGASATATSKRLMASYYAQGLERVARARRSERLPRRHPVHLVLEQPDVGIRDAGADLSPHDRRRALSRVRGGRARLAVRRESVGHVDGDRSPVVRHVAARSAFRDVEADRRRDAAGRARGWSRLSVDLREPARHSAVDADEYAPFNTGFIVYHDDVGDYSTNEPIMDGTGMLTYLLAALAP